MVNQEIESGSVLYIGRMLKMDAAYTMKMLLMALENMATAHGQKKYANGEVLLTFADYIIEDLKYSCGQKHKYCC